MTDKEVVIFKAQSVGISELHHRTLMQKSCFKSPKLKQPLEMTPERADQILKAYLASPAGKLLATFGASQGGRLVSHHKAHGELVAYDLEAYPSEGDGYVITAHKSKGSTWGIIPMDFSAAELRVAALGTAEGWGLKPATTGRRVEFKPELQELHREDPPGYWSPSNLDKLLKDGKC